MTEEVSYFLDKLLFQNLFVLNGRELCKAFCLKDYKRFMRSFIASLGLDLLSVERTPPFTPGFFSMFVRAVNKTFMPLFQMTVCIG